jgi:hypothetical protein
MAWSKAISRSLLQLGVTLLFISVVEGFALPTSANPQTPTTSSLLRATNAALHLHREATATIPTSTSVSTPLYLNVTTAAPDLLGIANISGLYGPGAWAAWFITGFAAWWRIFARSEEKMDVNTWAFLFGLNWAAVDIFRAIHTLRSISPENDAELSSHMGAFGAAFTVVFWGTSHALLQVPITSVVFEYSEFRGQRMKTLGVGLILPLGALLASTYLFRDPRAFNLLPALYYRGMEQIHSFYLDIACLTPILFSPLAITWFLSHKLDSSDPTRAIFEPILLLDGLPDNKIFDYVGAILSSISCGLFIVFIVLGLGMNNLVGFYFAIPVFSFLCLGLPILLPVVWVSFLGTGSVFYIWKGYFRRSPETWISESCFFMPCSPQSIKDEDQIYALLAGIFLFVGLEAFPPAFKRLRQWYRDNRLFVQMVEDALRQFEMRRRGTATSEAIDLEDV